MAAGTTSRAARGSIRLISKDLRPLYTENAMELSELNGQMLMPGNKNTNYRDRQRRGGDPQDRDTLLLHHGKPRHGHHVDGDHEEERKTDRRTTRP